MKYKVGDKVKIRRDLVDNEKYGAYKWYFDMHCKYIVINKVWEDCYAAYNNGTNWYYTDEMLDGLLEDTTATSDPTNAELIAAAKMLFEHCNKRAVNDGCSGCPFGNVSSDGYCGLGTPCDDWCLPHRKTRKEVFFEKFPNAQTTCEGRPLICARHILGYKVECINKCEACWNAPAESEETND